MIMVLRDSSEKKLIEETARFWSVRTGEHVSLDDALEMIQNVSRFFGILKRWQQQKDDNSNSTEVKIERKQKDERIYGFEDNATMLKI